MILKTNPAWYLACHFQSENSSFFFFSRLGKFSCILYYLFSLLYFLSFHFKAVVFYCLFSMLLLFSWMIYLSSLYVLDFNLLSDIWFANNFFHFLIAFSFWFLCCTKAFSLLQSHCLFLLLLPAL